jgi:dTDP-4-dehydrorhamnose reductase
MATIAVTGATGFVGSNIAEVLVARGHQVVGLTRTAGEYPWLHRVVDYSSTTAIAEQLQGVDAVVHCAIANDFHLLVNDRVAAYDAYVGLTSRLVRAAQAVGARTVYISTDWVHDGTGHLVAEDLPPNPLNIYGVLKALSEQVVVDLAIDGAIARIGGVMGQHRLQDVGPRSQDVGFGYFVASAVRTIREGGTFAVWGGDNVNEVATPSLASEIGAGVGRIIEREASGHFNLVCDDAVTRMELAYATCEAFDLDPTKVTESQVPASEVFPALVPRDTSMSTTVTRQRLGLRPIGLAETLEAFRRELDTGQVSPPTQD